MLLFYLCFVKFNDKFEIFLSRILIGADLIWSDLCLSPKPPGIGLPCEEGLKIILQILPLNLHSMELTICIYHFQLCVFLGKWKKNKKALSLKLFHSSRAPDKRGY